MPEGMNGFVRDLPDLSNTTRLGRAAEAVAYAVKAPLAWKFASYRLQMFGDAGDWLDFAKLKVHLPEVGRTVCVMVVENETMSNPLSPKCAIYASADTGDKDMNAHEKFLYQNAHPDMAGLLSELGEFLCLDSQRLLVRLAMLEAI